ncbi:MAG: polysaccharide biosynthesis tyrosine autokinase [Leptolyngbya sp. DLM2.Bin15]|nr:MAG: polysaccharide biosynthesis tyrosine autokinase [Leptolyngbya sp. DLM2.Bin15]
MVSGSHQPPFSHHTTPSESIPSPAVIHLPYESEEMDLQNVKEIIYRRRWMLAGVAIATTVCFWGWTLTRTPIYRGEFQVLVEAIAEVDPSQELLREGSQFRTNFDYDTQTEVLRSPALLRPILETLRETYPDFSYSELAGNLSITRLRETKVLSVSYRNPDPERIQAVLDVVAEEYLKYSFEQRQTNLQQGVQFVEGQLPELRDRVNSLQQRLERFRQEYSLIDPESRGTELSRLISSIEEQQQSTRTQLSEAESLYLAIQSQLGYSPDQALAASALSESTRYQAILNEVQQVEAQIATESARFLPDTPNVQVLEDRRDSLLPLLEQEADRILGQRLSNQLDGNLTSISIDLSRQLINTANEVQVLQTRQRALADVEQQIKQEFDLVPALARQYTDLQRELSIATDSLNRFLTTRESLELQAAQQSIPWQLISEPTTMNSPIAPNVPRSLMLGAIAGALLGAGAAFVTDKLDTVFHTPDDLKAFARLPMLGVVPFIRQPNQMLIHGEDATAPARKPSSYHYQSSPFLESFRSLYTNIRFLGADRPIRSVVISSAVPAEGKSTIALNLARAAAIMGQRVLLVDADLRLPQVHERLKMPNLRGLSNVMTGDCSLQEAMQRSPIDENLTVMTAGMIPPDPIQLLSSQKMQQFNQQVTQDFDVVIYDMPPLLGFADSSLLAAQTDGMIVVVGLGTTSRNDLKQALDTLDVSPVSLLGVVANGIKSHTTRSYGYNRYHQYYKAYAEGAAAEPAPEPTSESWVDGLRQRFTSAFPAATDLEDDVDHDLDSEDLDNEAEAAAGAIADPSLEERGDESFTSLAGEDTPNGHQPIPSIFEQDQDHPYHFTGQFTPDELSYTDLYAQNHQQTSLNGLTNNNLSTWDTPSTDLPDLSPVEPQREPSWEDLAPETVQDLARDLDELDELDKLSSVPEPFADLLNHADAWDPADSDPDADLELEAIAADSDDAMLDELMGFEADDRPIELAPDNPPPSLEEQSSWLQRMSGMNLLSLLQDKPHHPAASEDLTPPVGEAETHALSSEAIAATESTLQPAQPDSSIDSPLAEDHDDWQDQDITELDWQVPVEAADDRHSLEVSQAVGTHGTTPIESPHLTHQRDKQSDRSEAVAWLEHPAAVDAEAAQVQSTLKDAAPPLGSEDTLTSLAPDPAVDSKIDGTTVAQPFQAPDWQTVNQEGPNEEQATQSNITDPHLQDKANAPGTDSPFLAAIFIAQQAIAAGQTAQGSEDWLHLAQQWQQASDLMGEVSSGHEQYEMAQQCQHLYQRNSDYARNRAIH